jgi:hypothetical protein
MGFFDRFRRGSQPDVDAEDDALRANELVPAAGGTWSGHLFENSKIGLRPGLTWSFTFEYEDVARDYGSSPVSLLVDRVPLPGAAWSAMAGHTVRCKRFAEPVECSAYFFEHYRYDKVLLRVLDQDERRIRVSTEAQGDIDGLGVDRWEVDQWLDFQGIAVQLDDTRTLEQAAEQLASKTDIAGLKGKPSPAGFRFFDPRPRGPSAARS